MSRANSISRDIEHGAPDEDVNQQLLLASDGGAPSSLAGSRRSESPARAGERVSNGEPASLRNLRLLMPSPRPADHPTPGSTPSPLSTATASAPRKWRRSDKRQRRLNTELLVAVEEGDFEAFERLLNSGASPNATCRLDLVSASHMAAICQHPHDFLLLLIQKGADRHRVDRLGRTPLHLAAWMGHSRLVAILLGFPEDMYDRVASEDMSSETEEDVVRYCVNTRRLANLACRPAEPGAPLPKEWRDNIDHHCMNIQGSLPLLQDGWTPLHVAAACARRHCTRLLLAAGADPTLCDITGRTPLDVAGMAHYYDVKINKQHFTQVIKMLVEHEGTYNTMKPQGLDNVVTPLHTAVELDCVEAIQELMELKVSIACLNEAGQTPLHLCVKHKAEVALQELVNSSHESDPFAATVDVRDFEGNTVLQAAVEAGWVFGVCVALEAGADVTIKALDGDTPIHAAAALGDLGVLQEILSVAKQKDSIDLQNSCRETALFKAISAGNVDCVKAILAEGANITIALSKDYTVFHRAAELGHLEILKTLVEHENEAHIDMINIRGSCNKMGFSPLHYAVFFNHPECVEYLLSKGADVRIRTCTSHKEATPLHLAALRNYCKIAEIILKFDRTTIHEVDSMGWFPLHTAAHNVSREIIPLLLQAGADLSGYTDGPKKYRRTAIDMVVNNLSKPTEYLEELFDSFITTSDGNLQDQNSIVRIDYSVLMPRCCEMEQMKVIEALLKTGNRYQQQRLLVHPLLESFLYLKWKALLPFFYVILLFYAFFLLSLTVFVVSVFFYKDTSDKIPVFFSATIWGYFVYGSVFLVCSQELLYMNFKNGKRYFFQLETWVKFFSLGMALFLPSAITIASWSQAEWPRHVATFALLLSWLEMMFLLSRFPNWGYYVLMFAKVAGNVVKILLTFAFLVIGFSLAFMIQFRSHAPFEGPWEAIVKTIVMMTSEFDYEGLFDEEHTKGLSTSVLILRIMFVIFLVLAAIVLMNLMVGVAVNDINDLEVLGNIKRLAKQVEFLGSLDTLMYNKPFSKMLPSRVRHRIRSKSNVSDVLEIYPGRPRWRHTKMIPSHLRDAIFNKATTQKMNLDQTTFMHDMFCKIKEIHQTVVNKDDQDNMKAIEIKRENEECIIENVKTKVNQEIMNNLGVLDVDISEIKDQISNNASKTAVEEVNVKLDQMSLEMEQIKLMLSRLESKISKI
ncbi:hypothetical protein JYU34_014995 [Plutella xylostella]|uniref:Ion transport domain-containing protein n=1 Tax=Plutella xylostella TaxID=51655 RepID=A0ABQ7Q610_PLUXY|nr:hypothetical protein JYU34_014995 [Plutella xylostella]